MIDEREMALTAIQSIDRNLKRWVGWFPDPRSEVSIPRNELLALKKFAEIGLQAHDLLEALDNLVSACELPGDHCHIEQALPVAIAAIAKATGGTE